MIRAFLLAVSCLVLVSCGYSAFERGRQMMMAGDVDRGLAELEKAAKENPNNYQYRSTYERERAFIVAKYVSEGDTARAGQRLAAAETFYKKALALEPQNPAALAGMKALAAAQQREEVVAQARKEFDSGDVDAAEQKLRTVLTQDPNQLQARALLDAVLARQARAAAEAPPPRSQLKSPFTKPITLEFRDATLKSVFEVISRASGINFVFDRDVRSDTKINIFVRDTSLDDVVKLIMVTNQLERKLLNENTVLIYPNTPAKQKEYKELVIHTYYLANADVKQALNLVKGMIKTPDVFVDEKLNLMVVKDTPDAMRVVDRLMRALDLAEPEVMLEVEVLELAKSTLDQIGVKYPAQVNLGKVPAPGAATGDLTFQLGQGLQGFVVNPPIVVDIMASDADAKVLANPRIRVKNHEKAKVHIGSKVPVVTTTSTANVGVSSSVSYLDVGLKLDVEPSIYLHDEVAIKLNLEVSNIIRQVNISGTLAYELGTRTTATVLQLKDGETQILAGLISDEDRRTMTGLPGLSRLPLLSRLFSTQGDDKRKTEIVMMLTPHIVRTLDWTQAGLTNVPVGTDAAIGAAPLRISPTPAGSLALAPSGGAGPQVLRPAATAVPAPLPGPPPEGGVAGSETEASGAAGQARIPGQAPIPGEAPAPAPGAQGREQSAAAAPTAGALLLAAPLAARSGAEVLVSLALAPGSSATRATAELVYDPLQLEPVGAATSSPGRIPVRVDGSAAVRFRVLLSAGRAQVRVESAEGQDSGGGSVPVNVPAPVDITITP
jgi:general secretion pathway protein D